jgi:hypothetical protein
MKKVLMLAVALMVAATPAFAQGAAGKEAKMAKAAAAKSGSVTGTVSAVSADSITVNGHEGGDVTLAVDAKTSVQATGAGHKAAAAKADKQPTPITDFVHVGDTVTAKYTDSGSAKTATSVRVTTAKPSAAKKK